MLSHNELSTPPPEVEAIRKEYENMSYDEMSQRLAESYKEFEQLLGNRISIPSSASSDTEDEASTQVKEDDDCKKKKNVQKQFIKACTSSVENVKPYLEMKDMIDIDAKDEDGTTPLIYAACFGKLEIVQELLLAGANTDIQDARKLYPK
jgi:hypothetical protein